MYNFDANPGIDKAQSFSFFNVDLYVHISYPHSGMSCYYTWYLLLLLFPGIGSFH